MLEQTGCSLSCSVWADLICLSIDVSMPVAALRDGNHQHESRLVNDASAHLEACGIHETALVSAPAAALLLTTWFRTVIGFW